MPGRLSPAVKRLLETMTEVTGHSVALLAPGETPPPSTLLWPIRDRNGGDRGSLSVAAGQRPLIPKHEELYVQLTQLIESEIGLRDENLSLENRFRLLDRKNTELAAINRALSEMAYRDPVTRLFQKWYFNEQLKLEVSRAARHGKLFAILVIDIDDFRELNETHGSAEGDRILRSVAHILQQSSRTSDVLCRLGTDDFALLLTDTPAEGAAEVAGRIQRRCSEEVRVIGEVEVRSTCSIGLVSFDGAHLRGVEISPEVMTEQASRGSHRARKLGGNRVEVSAPPS
jgi:diguanylate cyclase (GGDEF)-like protein